MRHLVRLLGLWSLLPLLAAPPLAAQSAAGRWEGAIEVPNQPLAIVVTLQQAADLTWSGSIDIPAQNARALPLTLLAIHDTIANFAIADVPGDPLFLGQYDPKADTITGHFTQHGAVHPFRLRRASTAADAARLLAGFDGWLDATRTAWEVPGIAVAVVQGDRLVHTAVAGTRVVGGTEPVGADTLFAIGSSTKAFTCLLLGTLVDEGRLAWDEPVRTWLPTFRLADEAIAAALTPRDLVTHRSGLPRHDLLWYNADFTRADLVTRLRHLPLNRGLRAEFQYNNLLYLAAGHLAEVVTGASWEDLVRQRVFAPLGMTRSNFSVRDSQADADHALPCRKEQGSVRRIPFRDITTVGPAGSINSSVAELARWVALQLARGSRDGRPLLQPGTLQDLHTVRMPMGGPGEHTPQIVPVGYAMGWMVDVYRGHRRIHHGGNIDGFAAMVTFLPEAGWGCVALCNLDGSPLPELAVRRVCDQVLGLDPIDYSGPMLRRRDAAQAQADRAQQDRTLERREGTAPSRSLAEYCGEYEHPGYGIATVRLQDQALELELHRIRAPLEHWHFDVFRAGRNPDDPTLAETLVQFTGGMDGELEGLRMVVEPAVPAQVFARRPDPRLRDPDYLQRFVGVYQLGPQRATIALRDDALWATIPGQRPYRLLPGQRDGFRLDGLHGYSVRFESDADGKVTGVRFLQPEGVFRGPRVE